MGAIPVELTSYYIRGEDGSCVVRILCSPGLSAASKAQLAIMEAEEQKCCPEGAKIIYQVLAQRTEWYNRLISSNEAEAVLNSPEQLSTIR